MLLLLFDILMEAKLETLAGEYGGVENIIQALQRLKLKTQDEDDERELIVEVWRGESITKNVLVRRASNMTVIA